ncbi:MAG: hypothetical protein E2O40_00150, partial [Planctomycetota bacterium]
MSARKTQPDDRPGDAFAEDIETSDEAAAQLAELKDELEKAVEARQRALADFANYQRRAAQNE